MERDRVLAFRLARQGLAARTAASPAEAAACPASDYVRGWALLSLAARGEEITRARYDAAIAGGDLVLGPSLRAAIHAVAPADAFLYGRAMISEDDRELGDQLGAQAQRELREAGIAPTAALAEVAEATTAALEAGRPLTKDQLHAALRESVRPELLPWCRGCGSHHVAPMLWRYAGTWVGMRLDPQRRFVAGPAPEPRPAGEAARRFLSFYGPASAKELRAWGGLASTHARRLWAELAPELAEVRVDGRRAWLLTADEPALADPPRATGIRLLPPRDPYVQQPDRATLVPDPELRKRLFRPIANTGAVLQDGRLAGLWRARMKGARLELDVEPLERLDRDGLDAEAQRVAALRGAKEPRIAISGR